MSKFLPRELHDLSDNKKRVIQQVELQLQRPVKKKYSPIKLLSVAALLAISFGTYVLIEGSKFNEQQATIVAQDYTQQLKQYFADDETTKSLFSVNEHSTVLTLWLSDSYVVERVTSASQSIDLYYRVADNRIDFISQVPQGALLTIDELDSMPATETILQAPFEVSKSADVWEILYLDATVNEYKNVIVTQNVEGATTTKYYFAPQFGKIRTEIIENNELVYEEYMYNYTYSVETGDMQFDKVEHVHLEPTFHTPWLYSPDNRMRVTLEGLGEQASEEGVASIIVEDIETTEQTLFTITNVPYGQITPKEVVWVDNEHFLLIIGYAHGTVTVGGEVYLLDITNNILSPILTDLPNRQEISRIERIDDEHFYFERFTYDDDNFEASASTRVDGEIQIVSAIIETATNEQISYRPINSNETTNVSISLINQNADGFLTIQDLHPDETYQLIFVDQQLIGIQ